MIAAIYARKSTDQNVADEEKSVTRQVERARAYAERKGWTVAEEHVYTDNGISGAEFLKRPGFLRLMNALKSRPPFQVLILSEESRLGREQIQTAYALQQITDAGVEVWFYLTNERRKLDTAMDKIMGSLTGFAAEMEREKISQRTHDAMLRKAKANHVTGCKVFGYDNLEVLGPDGKRSHVTRKINESEAAVVRRIFDLRHWHLRTRLTGEGAERRQHPDAARAPPRVGPVVCVRDPSSRAVPRRRRLEQNASRSPQRHRGV